LIKLLAAWTDQQTARVSSNPFPRDCTTRAGHPALFVAPTLKPHPVWIAATALSGDVFVDRSFRIGDAGDIDRWAHCCTTTT